MSKYQHTIFYCCILTVFILLGICNTIEALEIDQALSTQFDTLQSNPVQLNIADYDLTYYGSTQRLVLLTFTIRCILQPDGKCPRAWGIEITPSQTQDRTKIFPTAASVTADNFLAWSTTSVSNVGGIKRIEVASTMDPQTGNALRLTMLLTYPQGPGQFTRDTEYESTFRFVDNANPLIFTEQKILYPTPDAMKRPDVYMYFYHKYLANSHTGPIDPSYDSRQNNAEFQLSAWYGFDILPPPTPEKGNPNIIDIRILGTGYFQLNETNVITPTTTVCWLNSLPVIVEVLDDQYIDNKYSTDPTQKRYYNQTLRVYATPRYDLEMKNENNLLSEPNVLPADEKNVDFFDNRFFMEFTCEQRLVYLSNPNAQNTDWAMLVRLGYTHDDFQPTPDNFTTNDIEYVNDRYPIDLRAKNPQAFPTHTPLEIQGLVNYFPDSQTLVCKTTLDFGSNWWLFNTTTVSITSGSDGIIYQDDPIDIPFDKHHSAATLSILPDLSMYPEYHQMMKDNQQQPKQNILEPFVFLSPLTTTTTNGPLFQLNDIPGFAPYIENVQKIFNLSNIPSILHISVTYHLHGVKFLYQHPSCVIITTITLNNNPDAIPDAEYDTSTVSYSACRHYNGTSEFEKYQQEEKDNFELILEQEQNNQSSKLIQQEKEKEDKYNGIEIKSNSYKKIDLTILNPNKIEWYTIMISTLSGISHIQINDATLRDEDNEYFIPPKDYQNINNNGNYYTTCEVLPPLQYANGTKQSILNNVMLAHGLREFQISLLPLFSEHTEGQPLDIIIPATAVNIKCPNVEFVDEPSLYLTHKDVEWSKKQNNDKNSIVNRVGYENYKKTQVKTVEEQMELKQYHQFITLYTLFNVTSDNTDDNNNNNLNNTHQDNLSTPITLGKQVYLRQLATFSLPPQPITKKSYTLFIVIIILIVIIFAVIFAFPIKRCIERYQDQKRLKSVQIQTTKYANEAELNDLIFEELDDEQQQ